jgi:hypothetical protein
LTFLNPLPGVVAGVVLQSATKNINAGP